MTSTLEQNVLTSLRELHLFDIAARTHAKWMADLEAKYPKGPRGGLNPIVRSARKMQDRIANFGPEALVNELLPHLVYAAERWQQMTDPDVARSRPYLRYVCACLPDSRPSHLEKHGLVFSMDHHFWDVLVPAERTRMHVHSHERIGRFARAARLEHFRKSPLQV